MLNIFSVSVRLNLLPEGIVVGPFSFRDLAADCPILLIFKHFTLICVSLLRCSLVGSKDVPAIKRILREPKC